ncbi:hypothetical protein FS749_013238 [Ceratobasidium sp. UAMH 11750]|nr:hypothetical protein FS749_013238 [Ceratobasidium sp. UAMH 11750]
MVLDPNEPPFDPAAPVVTLAQLPPYLLVKMERTRAVTLPGLAEGVLPIVPASKNYQIVTSVRQRNGEIANIRRNVRRLQFPITPAYAFTDYRSQGQTIPSVIVDIATPPTGGGLSLFNIYVALSRSFGRDTIRILREFDKSLLIKPLDYDLAREDEELDQLDLTTKDWWEKMKQTHGFN